MMVFFAPGVGAMQRLVGGNGQKIRIVNVGGNPARPFLARRDEKIDQPVNPLVADGQRGGKNERGLVQPASHLQPQNRFPRARSRYDVQRVLAQEAVQAGEHTLLVASPGLAEFDVGRK